MAWKECTVCGDGFRAAGIALTCSKDCSAERRRRENHEAYLRNKGKKRNRKSQTMRKVCGICAGEFLTRRPRQHTCGPVCRSEWIHNTLKENRAAERVRYHTDPEYRAKRIQNTRDWQRRNIEIAVKASQRRYARKRLMMHAAMALIKELGLEHKLKEIAG